MNSAAKRAMRRADFEWIVPAGHPAFAGHFPGSPIVPGVVLLDRVLLFAEAFSGKSAITWQIAEAKFYRPVGPGEKLAYHLHERVHARAYDKAPAGAGAVIAFSIRANAHEVAAGRLQATP
ncbi:conserved hypothetical protein [Candidatus Accumulibacter aalborgensis]|uniref:ApeI dehydratase-like domain-containing protein n=1 Tax=Candidatus Accumulibacter aalborgensis TaxID=1860102 RepID=A0A1A8XV03_9PROT|nr:hypothetical protein [Candidatus Accumulibacter aalborgensis]SBT07783.1 conserved hypothetical protein [Candidatus Accumulibacter aalborgensis]